MKPCRVILLNTAIFAISIGFGLIASSCAHADLLDYSLGIQANSVQNSGVAPTSIFSESASASYRQALATDFDQTFLTFSGPSSPITFPALTQLPFNSGYGSGVNLFVGFSPSLSPLQDAVPFGTYTLQASNSTTGALRTLSQGYLSNNLPSIPAVSASSFTQLRNLNPAAPYVVNLNPIGSAQPMPGYNLTQFGSLLFTNNVTRTSFSTPISLTSPTAIIPANSLLPNTSYNITAAYSNNYLSVTGTTPLSENFIRTTFLGTVTTGAAPSVLVQMFRAGP